MVTRTRDEKILFTGIGLSALVSGVGVMLFYAALSEPTILGYLSNMFTGSTLFISGVVGVVGLSSIYFNYQATL